MKRYGPPYHFNFFKSSAPHILLALFLNILTHTTGRKLWDYIKGVRTIASNENCPPDNYPPDDCPTNNCLPDSGPWGKLPSYYCSQIIIPKIIAPPPPRQYLPRNCPQGKLPFELCVAYIIALSGKWPRRKLPPGKLTQG